MEPSADVIVAAREQGASPWGPRGFLRAYSDSTPQAGSICFLDSPGSSFEIGVFLSQSDQNTPLVPIFTRVKRFLLCATNTPTFKFYPGDSR